MMRRGGFHCLMFVYLYIPCINSGAYRIHYFYIPGVQTQPLKIRISLGGSALFAIEQRYPLSQGKQTKTNQNGKRRKQKSSRKKRILQGSRKESIAAPRCSGFDEQSGDCKSGGEKRM